MDALGSAVLTNEIEAARAVAAVVSREEVRRALDHRDASPELVLEVVWADDRGEREQDTITIDWSRQDLENLLALATDERVVLTFDRAQLEQALGDVEAHGLRERALVFAVAATGVLAAGAGVGHAAPTLTDVSSTGGYAATSSAATTFVTDASSAGGYVAHAAAADQMVSDASSAGGYAAPAAAADQMVSDASSAGGYVAPAAAADQMVSDASSAGGYAAPAAAADQMVSDASSAGGYVAPAAAEDEMVSDASSAGGYVAPAPTEDSLLTDVSSAGGYAASDAGVDAGAGPLLTDASSGGGYLAPAPSSPADGGISFNALSPTADGAIAGAFVLTIAAAAFVSRRRKPEGIA